MSSHETIRVLEVEVDAAVPSPGTRVKTEAGAEEGRGKALEPAEGATQDKQTASSTIPTVSNEAAAPSVQNVAIPISLSLPHPQTSMPISIQACPQVLTQDGLATLMTGMIAQQSTLSQPLLIPLSMAGSVGGQNGLALLTLPATTLATLPGFGAGGPAGGLIKLPFAGLQAATVLNSVQPQLQAPAQTLLQPQAATLQSVQQTQAAPASTATVASVMHKATEPSASVATLQTTGLTLNPAIISAASLGAQPQFISSLTTTPIITNTNVAGLTSQIIANAQGQMIGTLPVLVNPASLTGVSSTHSPPAQGLQVQAVTPQLLLNSQGQIIATIGSNPGAAAFTTSTSSTVLTKTTLSHTKVNTQAPTVTVNQSPVMIAPQPSTGKSTSSSIPVACAEMPTVSQLVNKPQSGVTEEEGINLEEIREFAKNFKIRRLSLGLTQTQVGQALTATEGPAYSQSAICRFEKLDITPKSAQKLKPVLERWLAEAELWNQKGQQNLMEFVGDMPPIPWLHNWSPVRKPAGQLEMTSSRLGTHTPPSCLGYINLRNLSTGLLFFHTNFDRVLFKSLKKKLDKKQGIDWNKNV
ncbi:POU domain, class 6, transcription factor 1 isoform X3 [Neoarius graeffei]|nr:POU domain, class 6, transcription factor 1 isoform X3 [Neoarius graeffei]XP_060793307.1 POU domain, class 6, transcription factor 1 isoform X3 [Neoarius graeffei]